MKVVLILGLLLGGCATIKPYEKEYLLNPVMDDGQLARMQSSLLQASQGRYEKLGSTGNASAGTSCPTCGG
jgi:hypothetical protein